MELLHLVNDTNQVIYIPELKTAAYYSEKIKWAKLGERRTEKIREETDSYEKRSYVIDNNLARRIYDLSSLQTELYRDLKITKDDLVNVINSEEFENTRKAIKENFEGEIERLEEEINGNYERINHLLGQIGIQL